MIESEPQQILALLEEGRIAVPRVLEGVTAEMGNRIPSVGRWSIFGCVEHIAFTEDFLFAQVLKAVPSANPAINPAREAKMLARGTDRSRRIESPPEGHPTGRYPNLAAALQHFLESREGTIRFVQATQDDLRSQMTWHPILGDANNFEMLLSICLHPLRHVRQIEEIKLELG